MKINLLIILLSLTIISTGYSQLKKGHSLVGPTIGFWFANSVPTFGGNYEYQTTQLGETGTLGVGGILRYTTFKDESTYWEWTYTYITVGAQVNLNFNKIGNGKFVPFVGLVLGYNSISSSVKYKTGGYISSAAYGSGLWSWGQGGIRYFVSPNIALVVRFGLGNFNYNSGEFGVDFKF